MNEYALANYNEIKDNLDNLYQNKLIYHERITMIAELKRYVLTDDYIQIEIKALEPLCNMERPNNKRLYELMQSKSIIKLGTTLKEIEGIARPIKNWKIGRNYCPFILWTHPQIVKQIIEATGENRSMLANNLKWTDCYEKMLTELGI